MCLWCLLTWTKVQLVQIVVSSMHIVNALTIKYVLKINYNLWLGHVKIR